ncbi:helitron_like_N domain-containing protein [Trichonephila clavipes]|nr:helitron_like_N domain-containing protein [Trichonephila clavipes]
MTMFTKHEVGILIAASKSLRVMNYNNKYYLTDFHACGPICARASDTHCKACVIESGSLDDLVRVCKHATGSVEDQDDKVEDVLYLKILTGTAAYWRTALNELLVQIRCLGLPTYFLTFSCNDINWLNIRKSLFIADERPMDNPQDLDMIATQRLIEQHSVIVSRHFYVSF